jgi:hypothetical protein
MCAPMPQMPSVCSICLQSVSWSQFLVFKLSGSFLDGLDL